MKSIKRSLDPTNSLQVRNDIQAYMPTSPVCVRREGLVVFSIEKVDERFQQSFNVVAAVVAELDKKMK